MTEGLVDPLAPVDAHGVVCLHDPRHPGPRVPVAHLLLLRPLLLIPWPPALLSLLGVTLGLDLGPALHTRI